MKVQGTKVAEFIHHDGTKFVTIKVKQGLSETSRIEDIAELLCCEVKYIEPRIGYLLKLEKSTHEQQEEEKTPEPPPATMVHIFDSREDVLNFLEKFTRKS